VSNATAPSPGAEQWAGAPRVLVFTTLFPNPRQPHRGLFVRHRVAAVAQHCPTHVVAPILRRAPLPRGVPPSPRPEVLATPTVSHPAYATVPGIGRWADAALLYAQTLPHLRRLRAAFPFDVIDAHYAFPDGAAAVLLGAHFRIPVAVTVRGGDLDMLPRYRLRRRAIARTLQRADRIFAVSRHLAARAEELGAPRPAIRVVANGVDRATFCYGDRDRDRQALGIAAAQRLVVCAGNLLAEKGQHLLVEALGHTAPDTGAPHLVVIGSDPSASGAYRRRLEHLIDRHGLRDRARLLGAVDQAILARWYRAADVLVLPTFREGAPNVVREALACGTPVVASCVGGVPELVSSDALGLLVEPGDVGALSAAIGEALRRDWDRRRIAMLAAGRDWDSVGTEVAGELTALVAERSRG